MAKLTDEERQQLEALQAKHDAPDEPEGDDDGQGDDGHVIVLRGSRADSFLSELLGTGSKRQTGKSSAAAPAGGTPNGKSSRAKTTPAKAGKPAEGDDEDEPEGQQDEPPPRVNRYFR